MVLCIARGADAVWEDYIIDLEEWMRTELTCPDIIGVISTSLRSWRQGITISDSDGTLFEGVKEAVEFQNRIG